MSLLTAVACGGTTRTQATSHPLPGAPWDADQAASEAAAYLIRHLNADGRFDYVRRSSVSEAKYNILRHSGAIHSLVQYTHENPSPELQGAIVRAARYLRKRYVRRLPEHPELLAAVSRPGEETLPSETAKLGGTALALIALRGAYALDSSVISVEELQAMGAFLLFMQKPDGSFHSKYLVGDGFDPNFHSLYYPGETMLALTMLYDVDGDSRWLQAALRSAAQLVESRRDTRDWPADHWMMLASLPLLERYENIPNPALGADELRNHITVMAAKIMRAQHAGGHFAKAPRSTPAATRIEGLSALARIQSARGDLDPELRSSIERGIAFLMQCQLRVSGSSRGGVPRSCSADAASERRGEEIRIDYVQHYLSALLTSPRS
ncbi:MAG: hypothetical protein GY811_15060 [Myxococcales bacterium]|nr:hypothetical protein [Myxococcales bacterium]